MQTPIRKIIHADMDAFFASVEQRDFPDLRGKPLAVGGTGRRGVVAAASYEARKFGVFSAMPSVTAARLCPQLIFVKPRFHVYKEVSRQVFEIFRSYTDLVEPLSLDEAFMDVSKDKQGIGSATVIARRIKAEVFEKTKLTISAGVSYNKFLAKCASDFHKPNGLTIVLPDKAMAFLDQLKIEKFHGVGKVTAKKMKSMGILTGADLRRLSQKEMQRNFGKSGLFFYKIVRGEDNRRVNPSRLRKSLGAERTFFYDLKELPDIYDKLDDICEEVFRRMQQNEIYGKTVTLKIKFADFEVITRSKTYRDAPKTFELLQEISRELFGRNDSRDEIRLLGMSISNLNLPRKNKNSRQLEIPFPLR